MNLHEFQAKDILMEEGIPVPVFRVAKSLQEAEHFWDELGLSEGVIKIQVHAGGRGKAGGVKRVYSKHEMVQTARSLLGMKMTNQQTGPLGIVAHQIMLTASLTLTKEYYLGAIIDRAQAEPLLIASPQGGMDIEEIALSHPDEIIKLPILMDGTMRPYHLLRLAKFMGWKGETEKQGIKIAQSLAKIFIQKDGSLLEINPLVEDDKGQLWALDAKLSIDDNALFRQPLIAQMYDPSQYTAQEAIAKEHDLSYIPLDGTIGCMVNGAGLAMATMDIIQYAGSKPANFLDVGGSATADKIAAGFQILMTDKSVKAILVNIFGGIMSCITIAEGILKALEGTRLTLPLVVRLEGTHVKEAKEMIAKSGLSILTAQNLAEAAEIVVKEEKKYAHSRT